MNLNIVLFGATGMVGEGVLHVSLNHSDVGSVLVIGRSSCGITHPKLREIVHNDFFDYSPIEPMMRGYNACFFCLGVSSIGKNESSYSRITYDLTMEAARTLAELNRDMTFSYISGAGTDSSEAGRSMWARVKGKTENHLSKLPFKAVYLFRPGFIKPIRGLKNAFTIAKVLGIFHPIWRTVIPKYVCTLEELGLAMIRVSQQGYEKRIWECRDISRLGGTQV
jgi:uncharacterized protein YbjT (DUF2867 family)